MPIRRAALPPLLCCLFFSVGVAAKECPRVVVSADPNYPPLHWYDGERLRGASVDIVTRVFDDLKIPYEVKYEGPLLRVLAAAEDSRIDVVTTLKKTPERLSFLDFTSRPAFANPVAVFTNRDETFPFRRWEDLKGKPGVMVLGNKFGEGFDEFLETNLDMTRVGEIQQAFRMLKVHRVRYLITGLFVGRSVIAVQDIGAEVAPLATNVTETLNYVAFAKGSACLAHKPAFDKRLGELIESGAIPPILDQAFADWETHASARKESQ